MTITTFTLLSKDVEGQAQKKQLASVPGYDGNDMSPELKWVNPPVETKSFAITMYDPDAPSGSGWWNWLVFDIPADLNFLPEDAGNPKRSLMPSPIVQSRNNRGIFGYEGPCPPKGTGIHAYVITLYALNVSSLNLNKDTDPAIVGFAINSHTIQKASLVMYYQMV